MSAATAQYSRTDSPPDLRAVRGNDIISCDMLHATYSNYYFYVFNNKSKALLHSRTDKNYFFFGVPLSTDHVGSPVLANEPQEKSDRTAQEIREIRVKLESLIAAV
jgi:hypothetical protein